MKDKSEELILKVENLKREYKKQSEGNKKVFSVLKGLDLEVKRGEFIGIMGRSGCGKTTLLKILGLIDRPTFGTVYFQGRNTRELWQDELADIRRRELGFVFQDFYLMDSLSVEENIMMPMILDKRQGKECVKAARKYAKILGIEKLLEKHPYELSGGEKQRVAICRALINNPELLLADEPTGNLDSKAGDVVLRILEEINQKMGKTVLMVTHDPKMASHCNRLILLKDGTVQEDIRRTEDVDSFYQVILGKMKEL